MLFKLVCIVVFVASSTAAYYDDAEADVRDPNATFILYDVTAHKGVGLDLKSAFSQLKNVEYAFKVLGEDRAFFLVPDDNRCETLTTDFSGFKVDAQPIRGLNTSDVPASFNNTGLFIITIHITGEVDVSDLLSSVQQNCSACLRAFEVLGSKPKKYVLVGNIPLDQLDDIISSLTPGQDDTATTKRVIDFNTFAKEHSTGCIDVHKQHAEHQPVHVDYKPVHVEHKPVKIDYQPVNVEYKPVPAPTPRPSNGHSKSVSLRQSHEPKTPTRYIPEAPESPKVNFPKIEQNFYGQTEHDKVQDDHFQNINFPSTRKSQTGYAQPNFNGFGVQAKSNRFDTNHPGFGLSLHDNPSSRYVF